MIDTRFVMPLDGADIFKPDGTVLAQGGETVTWDSFWQRRLDDGVIAVTETIREPAPKPAAPKATARKETDQ